MKKILMILMLAIAPMALAEKDNASPKKAAQSCGYKDGNTTKIYCGGKTYSAKNHVIIAEQSVRMSQKEITALTKLKDSVKGQKPCKCSPNPGASGNVVYSVYKKNNNYFYGCDSAYHKSTHHLVSFNTSTNYGPQAPSEYACKYHTWHNTPGTPGGQSVNFIVAKNQSNNNSPILE